VRERIEESPIESPVVRTAHLRWGKLQPPARAAACHVAQCTRRVARTEAAGVRECHEFHDKRKRLQRPGGLTDPPIIDVSCSN
jgi:hypothetical protein